MKLDEVTKNQLGLSNITAKNIQSKGISKPRLIRSILNYPNSLTLIYEHDSSSGETTHFSTNGQEMTYLNKGYPVTLQFTNIGNIIPKDFNQLSYNQQAQILKTVFDNADVKVDCDCGDFYWGGAEEDLDKTPNPDASYGGFTGQPGKGIMAHRHQLSGGHNVENRVCKHIWNTLQNIDNDTTAIVKQLSGTINQQSAPVTATSTATTDEPLIAPEQPAGIPSTKTMSSSGTKSIKSVDAINDDIDEVMSTAEQLDLPKMETTEVKSKKINKETEVEEGPEDSEPPIETPSLPKELIQKEEIDENEPLEGNGETLSETLSETFKKIYENNPFWDAQDEKVQKLINDFCENYNKKHKTINERFELFEQIYLKNLKENFIPLIYKHNLIFNQNTNKEISQFIKQKLIEIPSKKSWKFAKPWENFSNGLEFVNSLAFDTTKGNETFLVLNNETSEPIGAITFYIGDLSNIDQEIVDLFGDIDLNELEIYNNKYIVEIGLIGFKENNITLTRDVLTVFDTMLKKYKIISWSVHNINPIKKAYDKIIQKYNGKSWYNYGKLTFYAIVKS